MRVWESVPWTSLKINISSTLLCATMSKAYPISSYRHYSNVFHVAFRFNNLVMSYIIMKHWNLFVWIAHSHILTNVPSPAIVRASNCALLSEKTRIKIHSHRSTKAVYFAPWLFTFNRVSTASRMNLRPNYWQAFGQICTNELWRAGNHYLARV